MMPGALELDLCIPHKNRGRFVKATHTVNGEGMCRECFGGQAVDPNAGTPTAAAPAPAIKTEAAKVTRKEINWIAVQNDRSGGMKVKEIAKKYGVSDVTIYTKTNAPKNGSKRSPRVSASTGTRPTVTARRSSTHTNGAGRFSATILELQTERDKLDEAIRVLQGLNA